MQIEGGEAEKVILHFHRRFLFAVERFAASVRSAKERTGRKETFFEKSGETLPIFENSTLLLSLSWHIDV